MTKSFYQYLIKFRNNQSNSSISEFANHAFYDNGFPIHEKDYHKLCEYLELNAPYLSSMAIFDEVYGMYLDNI